MSCTWDEITPCNSTDWGPNGCRTAICKRVGGPSGQEAEHNPAVWQYSREGQAHTGCTSKRIASMSKEVILPLYSALVRPHPQCWLTVLSSQSKRRIKPGADGHHKDWQLEHMANKDRLREMPAQAERNLKSAWKEEAPDSSWRCTAKEWDAKTPSFCKENSH